MPAPEIDRITLKKIFRDILYALNLEQGMGYTLKRLFVAPGQTVNEYLFEDRSRLTRPFQLIIFLVAIATFLTLFILPNTEQLLVDLHKTSGWADFTPAVKHSMEWFTMNMKQYFNVFFLAGIPFVSVATYLIFRKAKYYFAEHLIINTYVSAPQTVFFILYVPFINNSGLMASVQVIPVIVYTIYAYKGIFKLSWVEGVWRSVIVFIFYQFIFGLALLLLFGILVMINS